ncbi:hypothetical protein [Amycolatopsis sp. lyj-23]|uniref:hypothetical protein n=1 Tax=Amycolatopsis sp. lyj-23 TaxID=2789283 RepID=UPI003978FBB1
MDGHRVVAAAVAHNIDGHFPVGTGPAAGRLLGRAACNIDGHRVATARVAAAVAHSLRHDRVPVVAGV